MEPSRREQERVRRAAQGLPVRPTRAITASETLRESDWFLEVATAGGAVTLTLPKADVMKGRGYVVCKTDASANNVTADADGAELINGATTLAWNTQYLTKTFLSNGTVWYAW